MSSTKIKRLLAALMLGLMVALGGCVEEDADGGDEADVEMEMDEGEMGSMGGMGDEAAEDD